MPFGFNMRVDISRETFITDEYGGSLASGTIIYSQESTRMDSYTPYQRDTSREGMETSKTYSFYFSYSWQHNKIIKENDYITIVFPPHHPNYGERFRVRGIHREATHPSSPSGMTEVTAIRIVESRGNEF